ncbi:MAG: glycosyltransferase [Planctomycetaceae bacterium]|nr:glycosyltransferase [Planctomycetaceae bacterium]
MHILFVHQNFPAQFGHIAAHLVKNEGFRCTFLSELPDGIVAGIERIQFRAQGGATSQTHYCSRTFENQIWKSHALYETLRQRPDIQPDLIVGHSGFVSTLFLKELYDCPVIQYFEYFYHTRNSDIDFRSDLTSVPPLDLARVRARNAMPLLDLLNCDVGYLPTEWQRSRFPAEFQPKLRVIFDGIDTSLWCPQEVRDRRFGDWTIPENVRLVTYVSRGMESMRGFDIFMKVAKRLCELRNDVVFAVVGEDRVAYGGDLRYTGNKSFKQWVLDQDDYDLTRIRFLGRLSTEDLVRLLNLSHLHIYLTAPFVLSWSLMNALACGTTVLASDTPPVREIIHHQENGLLNEFFDCDGFVAQAHSILDDPQASASLGRKGSEMIAERYSLDVCLPRMLNLYREVLENHSLGRSSGSSSLC